MSIFRELKKLTKAQCVAFAVAKAEPVIDLIDDKSLKALSKECIDFAKAWIDNPTKENEGRCRDAADAAADAADAADAAAGYAAADAAVYAAADAAVYAAAAAADAAGYADYAAAHAAYAADAAADAAGYAAGYAAAAAAKSKQDSLDIIEKIKEHKQ
jgi:hypothetical protein